MASRHTEWGFRGKQVGVKRRCQQRCTAAWAQGRCTMCINGCAGGTLGGGRWFAWICWMMKVLPHWIGLTETLCRETLLEQHADALFRLCMMPTCICRAGALATQVISAGCYSMRRDQEGAECAQGLQARAGSGTGLEEVPADQADDGGGVGAPPGQERAAAPGQVRTSCWQCST